MSVASAGGCVSLPLVLRRSDVLHFLDYPEGRQPPPRIAELLDQAVARGRALADGRGAWVTLAPSRADEVGLDPVTAQALVVGLVTAGRAIEDEVEALLATDQLTLALLLDAVGSAAAEEAADRLGAWIAGTDGAVVDDPASISCRLSPGYGRWGLDAQRALFRLLPHDELGVTLGSSLMMTPRKSISFAMWLGATGRPVTGLAGCARCMLAHCRYRRGQETS